MQCPQAVILMKHRWVEERWGPCWCLSTCWSSQEPEQDSADLDAFALWFLFPVTGSRLCGRGGWVLSGGEAGLRPHRVWHTVSQECDQPPEWLWLFRLLPAHMSRLILLVPCLQTCPLDKCRLTLTRKPLCCFPAFLGHLEEGCPLGAIAPGHKKGLCCAQSIRSPSPRAIWPGACRRVPGSYCSSKGREQSGAGRHRTGHDGEGSKDPTQGCGQKGLHVVFGRT